MRPLLNVVDVGRYAIHRSYVHLLFPYTVSGGEATLIPAKVMEQDFAEAWRYLKRFESQRRSRETRFDPDAGVEERPFDDDQWYRFGRTQNLGLHRYPKLAVPRLVSRLSAAIDATGAYCLDNVDVGGVIVPSEELRLWIAVMLNSKVLDFIFRQQDNVFRGGFRTANRQFIDPLPIPPMGRDAHLTRRILRLARDLHGFKETERATPPEDVSKLAALQRQFEDADRELEKLVADVYRLSQAEKDLVFGSA